MEMAIARSMAGSDGARRRPWIRRRRPRRRLRLGLAGTARIMATRVVDARGCAPRRAARRGGDEGLDLRGKGGGPRGRQLRRCRARRVSCVTGIGRRDRRGQIPESAGAGSRLRRWGRSGFSRRAAGEGVSAG